MTGKVVGVKRVEDSASIPICVDNTDYKNFLKWNGEQEVPLDLDSVIVPDSPDPNIAIKAQIAVLDLKRIRPLAEGDADYLKVLTDQIVALRSQLK
jgi:hypothetical protein